VQPKVRVDRRHGELAHVAPYRAMKVRRVNPEVVIAI
jgi:hypothetical protein